MEKSNASSAKRGPTTGGVKEKDWFQAANHFQKMLWIIPSLLYKNRTACLGLVWSI